MNRQSASTTDVRRSLSNSIDVAEMPTFKAASFVALPTVDFPTPPGVANTKIALIFQSFFQCGGSKVRWNPMHLDRR
jgi:hypothetical protein